MPPRRAALQIAVLLAVLVAAIWALATRPWDTRMGAAATARALEAKVHANATYHCRREENDGTIALHDVDYWCESIDHPEFDAYWVGTDHHRITEIQSAG